MTQIFREDLVFPVNANGSYQDGSSTASNTIRMGTAFFSRARSTQDFIDYSVICNYTPVGNQGPVGMLSLYVTNASFTLDGKGMPTFTGPVDWVLKKASTINVGGTDTNGNLITPPFDISVALNCYSAMRIGYTPSSGDGLLYAKIGGVGV
jgi:hypothetical protein